LQKTHAFRVIACTEEKTGTEKDPLCSRGFNPTHNKGRKENSKPVVKKTLALNETRDEYSCAKPNQTNKHVVLPDFDADKMY